MPSDFELPDFTPDEYAAAAEVDFFARKQRVGTKVQRQLTALRAQLRQRAGEGDETFPPAWWAAPGKIARGENYRGLPYFVLDYPSLFGPEGICTYRTLFWWGHGYSATLHLQGAPLATLRHRLVRGAGHLRLSNTFVGVHRSPWEYHYGPDNYRSAADFHPDALAHHLATHPFVKLHRRLPLAASGQVVTFGTDTLAALQKLWC